MSRRQKRFKIHKIISDAPMSVEEWEASEKLFAKMIADKYAADHPELFEPRYADSEAAEGDQRGSSETAGGPNENTPE